MMGTRWTEEELMDLGRLHWSEFKAKYPNRTYDSWEVKRRRVTGGSAGTGVTLAVFAERRRAVTLVNGILEAVQGWAEQESSAVS